MNNGPNQPRIPEEGVDFDIGPTGYRGADSDVPILGRVFRPSSPLFAQSQAPGASAPSGLGRLAAWLKFWRR